MATNLHLNQFTQGYLDAALWDADPNPGQGEWRRHEGADYCDVPEAWLMQALVDCAAFRTDNADDLSGCDPYRAGMDFYLTRNGHGAGYWDGDYPEWPGRRLTSAAEACGEAFLLWDAETNTYLGIPAAASSGLPCETCGADAAVLCDCDSRDADQEV